ncbi:hypothetical protein BKA93DRAFT_19471 [Sparassis latifolia]
MVLGSTNARTVLISRQNGTSEPLLYPLPIYIPGHSYTCQTYPEPTIAFRRETTLLDLKRRYVMINRLRNRCLCLDVCRHAMIGGRLTRATSFVRKGNNEQTMSQTSGVQRTDMRSTDPLVFPEMPCDCASHQAQKLQVSTYRHQQVRAS